MAEKIVYRASELGSCLKALVASRSGYEPAATPDDMQRIFREGNLHEEAVIKNLLYVIIDRQREVELPITGNISVIGHIDGAYFGSGNILEVKTMGDAPYQEFIQKKWDTPGLVQRYKWQLSCYMHALGKPAILIVKNRNNGKTYELPILEEPFYDVTQIRARVLQAEAMARAGQLPVECDVPSYPCPFYYLHEDKPRVEGVDDVEFDALVVTYMRAKEDETRAGKVKKDAQEMIGKLVGDEKHKSERGASATPYTSSRKSFDEEKMREDGLDPEKYKTEKPFTGLRVSCPDDLWRNHPPITNKELDPSTITNERTEPHYPELDRNEGSS